MAIPHAGDVIAGKLRIERVIAQGGMGVVVAAHHLHLDQRVAVKFLLPEMLASSDLLHRFVREARAAAKIKSEHVVRVFDVGTMDDGAPYLVMEFLEGTDLGDLLKKHGPLAVNTAIDYVLQACEAIAEAHAASIVHRDLKPANLFLAQRADGSALVKVFDFGISKMPASASHHGIATSTTTLMGSPLYMSPEQMRGAKNVDLRSDIWALGVILFELMTGVLPFDGETMPVVCTKVLHEPARSLRSVRGDLSPTLEAIVARCLAKDPAARFQDVGELAMALAPFASPSQQGSINRIRLVVSARSLPTLVSPESSPRLAIADGVSSTISKSRGSGRAILIGAGAFMIAIALGTGLYFGIRKPSTIDASKTIAPLPTIEIASSKPAASESATLAIPVPTVIASSIASVAASTSSSAVFQSHPIAHPHPSAAHAASAQTTPGNSFGNGIY